LISYSEEKCGDNINNCINLNDDNLFECHTCSEGYQQSENFQSCGKSTTYCEYLDNVDTKKCKNCEDGYQLSEDLTKCGLIIVNC